VGGIAIRLAFDRLATARQMEQLEKDKSQATLEMLKNQISPHFLFNALNTIYYKIDRDNSPARSMVEMFSSLLRYQLYECNEAEVDIQKELRSLANYIELQKERANKPLSVVVDGGGFAADFHIAPFILMPIVENCFKHVSQSAGPDNFIKIAYGLKDDGWFSFETTNTIGSEAPHNNGIGLPNIKKRLDLIYPGRYSLNAGAHDSIFKLDLKIRVV
jgi:LytS/YehU family sensor histidine kinase